MKNNKVKMPINLVVTILIVMYSLFSSTNTANAQLKVNSSGTVTIGTGSGTTTSTLNLYSTNYCTIYSRATFTAPECDAIKSEVFRDDACAFAAYKSGSKNFYVYGNGNVWSRTNVYSSDSILKENVETIVDAKDKLLRLDGLKYNFKDSENKALKHFGFMAQDVEKVFPEIVYKNEKGIKGIAYTELIPIIIEALKELQNENDNLLAKIEDLKNEKKEKSATLEIDYSEKKAILDQNIPNPFSSKTRINMYIPSSISSAKLYIYNMQGEQLKQISINERGNTSITIDGYSFKAGMYLYTLITDEKEINTRKMILTD